jgi:hypothetical protein
MLVHDLVEIEKRGVPTVGLIAKPFELDARLTAKASGMPFLRHAVMEVDALTNLDQEDICNQADAVAPMVLSGLREVRAEERLPEKEEGKQEYTLETFQGTDRLKAWEEFNQYFLEKGWGDGFPLVAPTEEKVATMLAATSKDPGEVITILEPGYGVATVKIIAINAVMAGCQPKHLPVVLAAVKAMSDPQFRLRTVAMSTGPHAPMLVINGPIAKELNVNSGRGALGPGRQSWSNTVLGRAIRLVLMNVGHAYVGAMDLDTIGSPNKYSMCIAENEEASPWQPYHVELGYAKKDSTVTVFGVESQLEIYDFKNHTPEGILTTYAGTIDGIGALCTREWLIPRRRADNAVLICPDHAKAIAESGWEKEDVQAYLHKKTQIPVRLYKNTIQTERIKQGCRWILEAPDDLLVPAMGAPDWFRVIVVGGAAGKSSFTSGVGRAITEKIDGYVT